VSEAGATTTTPASAAPAGDQPANAAPTAPPAAPTGAPAGPSEGGERPEGPAEETPSESTDLGGEKGGTDQPGGESDRNEFRRAAWTTFGGDRVGRDKLVFYLSTGELSQPLQPLPWSLEDEARHAFVPPPGWDRCRMDFRGRRTVVLRGTPGQGRITTAIRLLQTVESRPIFELDPTIDLARMAQQIAAQPLVPGTAFLLHEPSEIDRLTAHTFHSVENALSDADARLVVTVNTEVTFQDEELLRYQMQLPPPPQARAILTQHLCHLVGEERAEHILRHPELAEHIAETLDGDNVTCQMTALTAQVLSQAADPIDVAETARRLQELRTRRLDEFDMWFESLTTGARYFAVALAVLNGLPYEDVADAARRLSRRFTSGGNIVLGEGSVLTVAGSDPFQPSQAQLSRQLQAETEQTIARAPYGQAPATMIAYRDPDRPRQVVERAWKSYRTQEKLLDWLDDLVLAPSQQVRTFAGTALGFVAALDFEYVWRRMLTPWAHDKQLWKNQAAADALGVVAAVPGLQSGATWLVNSWYRNDNADARCTAAMALGTRLGQADADHSIRALERLAMVDEPSVRVGIAHGLASLLADDLALAPEIYQVVRRCMADRERIFTGHYAFLFLAEDVYRDVSAGDGETVRWPALLHLAWERPELRRPLFDCWVRVLIEGRALAMAQHVLRVWAGRAEANPNIRNTFTRVARAVALLDARAGAVLARTAKQWNSDEEMQPLPAVARAVNSVVPGGV
jgi:hypothetical protein